MAATLRSLDLQASRKLDALGSVLLVLWLSAPSLAFRAQLEKQSQPASAPPDLQITQVRKLAAPASSATSEIEIRWTAQVPRLTTIDGFDVLLEARYGDGSRGAARSEQLKPSARSAILQLATHPKHNSGAALKDFRASVKARFRIASSLTLNQQVSPSQAETARAGAASANGSQPEVVITSAKLGAQGCASGQQCVDVGWTASAPHNISISKFTVSVDALHKNGAHSSDLKTISGAEHQAKLSAGPAGSEIASIKISLLTSFFLLDSKTVVREGAF
ncbi:MAG TPA: hypothetical protein VNN73_15250 [Blastocatellia bacterium]|nr:hypothetical protein [Blastocatellia bacterium]